VRALLIGSTPYRSYLESHVPGILHAKMRKSTYAKHCDEVARLDWRVSECVEGGETCTQQWSCIDRRQIVRNRHEVTLLGDHHLGIAAIVVDAGIFLVSTIHEIATAAAYTVAATSTKDAYADTVAKRSSFDILSKLINYTHNFMSWYARPVDRKRTFDSPGVRMANATGLNLDTHETHWRLDQGFCVSSSLSGAIA